MNGVDTDDERAAYIAGNRGLIMSVITRHFPNRLDLLDDMMQAGAIGLANAFDKFDADRNCRLSTLATWEIRGRITDTIRRHDRFRAKQPGIGKAGEKVIEKHGPDTVADAMQENDVRVMAEKVLACLANDRHRAVVRMRCIEGRGFSQISQVLGVSYKRAHQIYGQAVSYLQSSRKIAREARDILEGQRDE